MDEQHIKEQILDVTTILNDCKKQLKQLKIKDTVTKNKQFNNAQIDIAKQSIHHLVNEYYNNVSDIYIQIHSQYPNTNTKETLLEKIASNLQMIEIYKDKIAKNEFTQQDYQKFMYEDYKKGVDEIQQEIQHFEQQINRMQKASKTMNQDSLPTIKINNRVVEGLYLSLTDYATVVWPSDSNPISLNNVIIDRLNYFTAHGCLVTTHDQKQEYGYYNVVTEKVQTKTFQPGPQDNINYQPTIVVAPDSTVYFVGGVNNQGMISNCFHRLDLQSDALIKLPSMSVKRAGASACWVDGFIYVMGGRTDHNVKTRLCERYNVQKQSWEYIAKMNIGKARAACCFHQETQSIYMFFGTDSYGQTSSVVEKFSVAENSWTQLQISNYLPGFDITFGTAIQINKEQILIFGGLRDSMYFKDQMYFNRKLLAFHVENECFSTMEDTLPIDFLPLQNPIIMNQEVIAIGTFMKQLDDKPQLNQDGAFVVRISSEAPRVIAYVPSRGV